MSRAADDEAENNDDEPLTLACDPSENLKLQPKKSILKAPSVHRKSLEPKEAHFDELNILATLHPPDKDYGFMKIDEPKTPYNYMSENECEDGPSQPPVRRVSLCDIPNIDPQDMEHFLNKKYVSSSSSLASTGDSSDNDEEYETEERRAKRLEFERKRKLHYNEYRAAHLATERRTAEDEEDEMAEAEENIINSTAIE